MLIFFFFTLQLNHIKLKSLQRIKITLDRLLVAGGNVCSHAWFGNEETKNAK